MELNLIQKRLMEIANQEYTKVTLTEDELVDVREEQHGHHIIELLEFECDDCNVEVYYTGDFSEGKLQIEATRNNYERIYKNTFILRNYL